MGDESETGPLQIGAALARGPPQDLREILDRSVTLETAMEEFLLIAGWCGYHRSATYLSADDDLRRQIDKYVRATEKRQNLRAVDVCFWNSLEAYNQAGGQIRTLGDLEGFLREKGPQIKNLGYRTIAHLNVALQEHGMQAFRVRPYPDTPYQHQLVKRAGLEPV